MRIDSRIGSVDLKKFVLAIAIVQVVSGCVGGAPGGSVESDGVPISGPIEAPVVTPPADGATGSPAPVIESPYASGKVRLDFETMLVDSPEFARANPELRSVAAAVPGGLDTLSDEKTMGVVLPQGLRLTMLLKNDCVRAARDPGGRERTTGVSSSASKSKLAMARVLAVSDAPQDVPNEALEVQAYSIATDRGMTVGELADDAAKDACVIGIANETLSQLDPVDLGESPVQLDEPKDEPVAGSSDGADRVDGAAGTMVTPNDTYFNSQKFMATIGASTGWDRFYDPVTGIKTPVVVAIVDTGIYASHLDLAANMWKNPKGYNGYDFSYSDNTPNDGSGHGTHVAGLIGAVRGNSRGVSGVAGSHAKLMAVRVLNASGSGTSTNIINGIGYAVKNGAQVINMSLGGMGKNSAYQYAITNAVNAGVTVVSSAGNSSSNLSDTKWHTPSCYARGIPGYISVGSIDSVTRAKSSFSNYSSLGFVEIGSPGSNGILSTRNGGGYVTKAGTSMAAPIVSGAVALAIGLLKSRGYEAPPALIEQLLRESGAVNSALLPYFAEGKYVSIEQLAQLIDSRYPQK